MFKKPLETALIHMPSLFISPEVVGQLDWVIVVGPFQRNYSVTLKRVPTILSRQLVWELQGP